jgi:hypothetical protein
MFSVGMIEHSFKVDDVSAESPYVLSFPNGQRKQNLEFCCFFQMPELAESFW